MVFEIILLFIGIAIVSSTVSYMLWGSIREMLLKQDIFLIRDELWDKARMLGRLEDPAYIAARKKLNECISAGHFLSLPVMLAVGEQINRDAIRTTPAEGTDPTLQVAIRLALGRMRKRLFQYIAFQRPASTLLALFFSRRIRVNIVMKSVDRWAMYPGPSSLLSARNASESSVDVCPNKILQV